MYTPFIVPEENSVHQVIAKSAGYQYHTAFPYTAISFPL